MKKIALFALLAIICHSPAVAQTESICDSVLSPTVFNLGETRNTELFASDFHRAMCKKEWSSLDEAENISKGFNLKFSDVTRSLGIGATDNRDKSSLGKIYKDFCAKSDEEIAYSSAFFNRYRSSDFAVAKWSECIANTNEGHFALVVPDEGLSGATIRLTRRSAGVVPALSVQSIQAGGAYQVSCFYGSEAVTTAKFPEGQREIAITCLKRADVPATFTINTNWGVFDPVYIPGFNKTLSTIQSDIAETRNDVRKEIQRLKESIVEIEAKAIKRCRVCFHESVVDDQCRGSRDSCSDWAAVGRTEPAWTQPFMDDTDERGGGCTYQWRLQCE